MQEDGFSNNVTLQEEPATTLNTTPKNVSKAMHLDHFFVVLNKLAILGMLFCIFSVVGQVIAYLAAGIAFFVYIIFMFSATVLTLGIALASPEFREMWGYVKDFSSHTEKINEFFNYVMAALPYVSGIALVISIVSIVGLSLNKHYRHPVRIVMAGISCVVAAISLIFILAGGAKWTH